MNALVRRLRLVMTLALLIALLAGIVPSRAATAADADLQIRLVRYTFAPAKGEPRLKPGQRLEGAALASATYYLVQLRGPATAADLAALEARGATIVDYVPDYAYVVRMSPPQAKAIDASAYNYVGLVQPAYKLAPALDDRAALPADEQGRVLLALTTWPGESAALVARQAAALGGEPLDVAEHAFGGTLHLAIASDKLNALAALNGVAWIEARPQPVLHNDVARGIMGTDDLQNLTGLYGEGQIVAVADTGLDVGDLSTVHPDFRSHLVAGYAWGRPTDPDAPGDADGDWSDGNGHGTHVAGSVLGDGSASGADPLLNRYGGSHAGSAPKASLIFQSIADTGGALVGLPSDLGALFGQAYEAGARIHTNSWGSDSNGAYSAQSRQADTFLWQHPDMLITFSAGNEGIDANSNGVIDSGSLGDPASAKSVLTVGASENNRSSGGLNPGGACTTWYLCFGESYPVAPINSDRISNNPNGMAAFSSRGPAADGRIKPDVVAPGTNILSARSQADGAETAWGDGPSQWYGYEGGTSMSTPLTAGSAAIVRQHYVQNEQIAPSGALLKATIINGAVDLSPGQYASSAVSPTIEIQRRPDINQGWGRVNVNQSILPDAPGALWFDDRAAGIGTGQVVSYTNVFTVGPDLPSAMPLRVTLTWYDYPASLIAQTKLVNDLDLVVVAPNGTIFTGNDLVDGTLDGDRDSINPVEGIEILNPIPGAYTVAVRGFNVPFGPQPYAVVLSGPAGGTHLTPPHATQQTVAGRIVSYNLSLRNSTGASKTYALSLGGGLWDWQLSTDQVTLAAGEESLFTVDVTTPAASGADSVTVTASASGSSAQAVLVASTVGERLQLVPGDAAGVTAPSNTVVYPQTITNRSGQGRTFNLATSGSWPAVVQNSGGTTIASTPFLGVDESFSFRVQVTVPAGTLLGSSRTTTLTVSAAGAPSLSATALLTTTAALEWQQQADLPASVEGAILASDGSKLHLFGGMITLFPASISNGHATFDPATGAWTSLSPMPATTASPTGALYDGDACVMNGRIYIPGGRYGTASTNYDGALRIYNTATSSWLTPGPSVTMVSAGKQPIRYKAVCDASADGGQGALYLIGGADRASTGTTLPSLTDVYRYRVATNSWTKLNISGSLPLPRQLAAASLIDGKIYVAGGQSSIALADAQSTLHIFTISTGSWTAGPSMPAAQTAGGSAAVDGNLYLFGGRTPGDDGSMTTGRTLEFSPATNSWRQLPSLITPRYYVAGAALGSSLYAAGGVYDLEVPKVQLERLALGDGPTLSAALTKSAPAILTRGQTFRYTLVASASGTGSTASATLSDLLPADVTFVGALSATSGSASYSAQTRTVSWSGALSAATPVTITFDVRLSDDAAQGSWVENLATLNDGTGRTTSLVTASARSQVSGPSGAFSSKGVWPPSAIAGETVTYTLELVNTGVVSASGVLTDALPAGLDFVGFIDDNGGRASYAAQTRTISWAGPIQQTAITTYTMRPTTFQWVDIAQPANMVPAASWIATSSFPGDDEGYAAVQLPWPAPFLGVAYSTIYLDANGQIGFSPFTEGTALVGAVGDIPDPAAPNHRIALHHADLDLGYGTSGAGAVYTFHDVANARFIITYKDTAHAFGGNTGTWQLIIEQSGRYLLQYQTWGQWDLFSPVGVEDAQGSYGIAYSPAATLLPDGTAIEFVPAFYGSPRIIFAAEVNPDAPFGGELVNTAQLALGDMVYPFSASLAVHGANPSITKTASTGSAALGSTVTYTVTVENTGSAAGPVVLTDQLPAGLAYVPGSATGGASFANGALGWSGELAAPDYARTATNNPAAFTDISATGTPLGLGDEDAEVLDLPFTFPFYGTPLTRTSVVANGYLVMFKGSPPISYIEAGNAALATSRPHGMVAPLWTDLDPTPSQLAPSVDPTIFYQTLGSAPSRRFVVQWNNVPRYDVNDSNTFQVILHEADGRIQFAYADLATTGTDATVGIEDLAGVRVSQHSYNSPALSDGTLITFAPVSGTRQVVTYQATLKLAVSATSDAPLPAATPVQFQSVVPVGGTVLVTNTAVLSAGLRSDSASALVSTTGGTGPFTYLWNFGDGATSTAANPSHAYSAAGRYQVTLTVTDANSRQGVTTLWVDVLPVDEQGHYIFIPLIRR